MIQNYLLVILLMKIQHILFLENNPPPVAAAGLLGPDLVRRILDAERVAPLVCSFVYLCRKSGGRKVSSLFAKLMPHQCGSVGVGGVN